MDSSIHFHYTRHVNPDKIDELWSCDRLPDDDIDPELLTQTSEFAVLFQNDPILASSAAAGAEFSSADDDLFVNSPTTSVPFVPPLVGKKTLEQQDLSSKQQQTLFLSSPFSRQNEQFPTDSSSNAISSSATASSNPNDNSMATFLNSPFDAGKFPGNTNNNSSAMDEEMSIEMDNDHDNGANIQIAGPMNDKGTVFRIPGITTAKMQTPPSPSNKKRIFPQQTQNINMIQQDEEEIARSDPNSKKRRTMQNIPAEESDPNTNSDFEKMKIDAEEEDELMDNNQEIRDNLIRGEDLEFENWLEKKRKKSDLNKKSQISTNKQKGPKQHQLLFEGNPDITENWKIDQKLDLLNALLTTEDDVAVDEDQQPPHMAFMNEMIGANGMYGGLSDQMLDFTMSKLANQNSWGELALGSLENEGNE